MTYWDAPEPMSDATRLALFAFGLVLGALLFLVIR